MSKAVYWSPGKALDFKNETDAVIEAESVVAMAGMIGVAGCSILPGETGSVAVSGVFEIKKTDAEEIAIGTAVAFDGTGITAVAKDNTPAGYAAEKSPAGAAAIKVKLLG